MCKMEEEILSHKEELLIYRKICLGFSSQMGLVHCLMGLEGGCKSTPNRVYTSVSEAMIKLFFLDILAVMMVSA